MNFKIGVAPVIAGQRVASVETNPELTVKAGRGGFSISAAASKGTMIGHGDSVQFHNNVDGIMYLIQSNNAEFIEYAKEEGYDLSTEAGRQACIEALTQWYIGKGYAMFDRKGNPITENCRTTKEEKAAYIAANKDIILEHGREELEARATAAGEDASELTDDQLLEYLTDKEVSDSREKFTGSLASNVSKKVGTGITLSFSDSHIWSQLRKKATAQQNTIYNVEVANYETISVNDGYKDVEVIIYPINFVEYRDTINRTKK